MASIRRLCVYCGSSRGTDDRYRAAAERLGTLMAEAGIELVYGGGRVGLMGVIADAVLARNGRVSGIIPTLLYEREVAHPNARLDIVASMHERKQRMFDLADGFVALPGGLGTLDETLEMVTWRQLGLHDKPMVLLDVGGYWEPLTALVEQTIAHGFAPAAARSYWRAVGTAEEVLPALAAMPEPRIKGDSRVG